MNVLYVCLTGSAAGLEPDRDDLGPGVRGSDSSQTVVLEREQADGAERRDARWSAGDNFPRSSIQRIADSDLRQCQTYYSQSVQRDQLLLA